MSEYKRLREFVEGEDAKADDIETEFDGIAAVLQGGIGVDNIAEKGIQGKNIADGTITPGKLAPGYAIRHTFGFIPAFIPGGASYGAANSFAHGLGVFPTIVEFTIAGLENYAISFNVVWVSADATNFKAQAVASSPIPGGGVSFGIYWHAMAP